MRVFLSHTSRDKPLLRELRGFLPRFLHTWIDEDQLLIGTELRRTLQSVIEEHSDFVVIFVSDDAAKSEWVQQELAWALSREKSLGSNFILPVLLSANDALVDELGLQGRLFLRCASYSAADIKSLASKLSDHLFHWAINRLEASRTVTRRAIYPTGDWAFDMPNVLVVFDHAAPDLPDRSYVLSTLKVTTVRALRDGSFEVHSKRSSTGTIVSSEVISNPVSAISYGDGTPQGGTREKFHDAHTGDQFVQAFKTERRIRVGDRSPLPDDDPVLAALSENFLLTPMHAYSGTRISAHTERVRLLIYFNGPVQPQPSHVHTVLIEASGRVSARKIRLKHLPEKSLYVIEADDLPSEAGLYAYWRWPQEAKVILDDR